MCFVLCTVKKFIVAFNKMISYLELGRNRLQMLLYAVTISMGRQEVAILIERNPEDRFSRVEAHITFTTHFIFHCI